MTDYQQRISELLLCCQNEYVILESIIKENKASSTVLQATKELREGIKKLVHLQDSLDEIGSIVKDNTEWNKKADGLMQDVRNRLQFASTVTKINPMSSQSSPVCLSKPNFRPSADSIDIQEEDEDEDEDEAFIDASEELPRPLSPTDSNNSFESAKGFGRRSFIVEDAILNKEKKSKGLFPLLKGLRSSQSTPVKRNNSAPAQINFYKDDDKSTDAKHFIFATDAIVDHPLRIGVGYGSYICYSCTILSDKGAPITVRKRYSDFVELREELVKQYPTLKRSIPKLPPKKVVGKFTPSFVEQRRRELEYFFKFVVLHPVVGASPIVRHWIAP
ncbi:hypothetical protein INT48_009592 [Thamnidium elegans]|uniref:Endosomal/vacuolar adapter protein YPT35 n=1 Tax=Thamnidium elegans TaxID=101142 RepID=A0A8H7SIV6_9FUNG|nr:hypothetical protein INT48_009592 [Thamnidium elegans]